MIFYFILFYFGNLLKIDGYKVFSVAHQLYVFATNNVSYKIGSSTKITILSSFTHSFSAVFLICTTQYKEISFKFIVFAWTVCAQGMRSVQNI